MKMKSVLTVLAALAVLALFSASSALAAGSGPARQSQQRIEQKAAQARKVCQDKRLGPKTRSRQICSRYGICNNNVSCSQAVDRWRSQSLANLKKSPAAKPGPAQPPPQQQHTAPPAQQHNAPPPRNNAPDLPQPPQPR